MMTRAGILAALLWLAACGGSADGTANADANDVGAKAVADVDAAMAETLRAEPASRETPPTPVTKAD
jgi:hypothetical protein